MRKRTMAVLLTVTVATATLAVAIPGGAFASTTAGEVAAALDNVDAANNGLVAVAAQSSAVSVPNDPTKGVQFTAASGQKLTIGLPSASQTGTATKTRKVRWPTPAGTAAQTR